MVIRLAEGEDFTVYTKSGGQFKLPDVTNGTVKVAGTAEAIALKSDSAALAAAFDATAAYAVGDFATYDGRLYRCVATIQAGTNDPPPQDLYDATTNPNGHWVEETVSGMIGDVEAALHTINNGASSGNGGAT